MLTQLQRTFQSQQRFIANASHELRTPLAVIRATVDVAATDQSLSPDAVREMTADVREAVDHAESLIGALLILARNERGLTAYEQIDLATVVEDVLDTGKLGDRHLRTELEPAPIAGDPVLAERLVVNLIDNALRYNLAAGEVWIRTHCTPESSQLFIANTGPIISQVDSERILQPFQRLDDRTSHDGFGLGLTIVASIAAIHNGTLTAEPRSDGGLAVTVTIPTGSGLASDADHARPTSQSGRVDIEPSKERSVP
jgi:signal transduction histidine kinase